MVLPIQFENRMKSILGSNFERFMLEFQNNPYRALRINTLKCDKKFLKDKLTFLNEPTKFCDNSYYLPSDFQKPGNHPLHHAGAFYIQEPSASAVVEAIGIEENDKVLDLCASPGGKSTQAAAKLNGTGLLVCNEYVASRVQPLLSNIERMGIPNAVVTSAHPDELCSKFAEFFDKVIVDAPCSGEGMFRKDFGAVQDWSVENVKTCAERQLKILYSAAKTVKKGGKLVYSTCTYSPEENEMTVERFLNAFPDFVLVPTMHHFGQNAIKEYAPNTDNIEYARRIFNFDGGEGHFVAVMQRLGECEATHFSSKKIIKSNPVIDGFNSFFKENFTGNVPENITCEGDKVYIIPEYDEIADLKAVRKGMFAGIYKNGRFIPEHSLFNTPFYNAVNFLDLDCDSLNVKKFLHGEEIDCDITLKGYVQIRINGIPTGFGKASNGRLKNHYPKGLRTL